MAESQTTEIDRLKAKIAELRRCFMPIWMGFAEAEMVGEPVPDNAVVLHFMGSGASDQVTAGDIRKALSDE